MSAQCCRVSRSAGIAYPLTYFADPSQPRGDLPLGCEWGTDLQRLRSDRGWRFEPAVEDEAGYDFDVARWIGEERLGWIAPADRSLTVRFGPSGCPYVNLPGRRSVARIEEGDVWWP